MCAFGVGEGGWNIRRVGRPVVDPWRGSGWGDGCQHVQDRMVSAGADVESERGGARMLQGQFDRPGDVVDVGEVAALAAVTVDDDRLARLDLAAECLQGDVVALAGTPDGEEAQGDEVQTVELRAEPAPLLGVELGQGVGTPGARQGGVALLGRAAAGREPLRENPAAWPGMSLAGGFAGQSRRPAW